MIVEEAALLDDIVDECGGGEGELHAHQYYDSGSNLHGELINTPHPIAIFHQIIFQYPP
jgi:hypothetical protein